MLCNSERMGAIRWSVIMGLIGMAKARELKAPPTPLEESFEIADESFEIADESFEIA